MAHDATKVYLGNTTSSFKHIDSKKGAIAAGLAVSVKSDGTVSVAVADGPRMGISLGKDMSDAGFMAIVRSGLKVPLLLTSGFTPTLGAAVVVSDTTGKAIAAGAGATAINATYASSTLTAILEDGTTDAVGCALIDMPGGV